MKQWVIGLFAVVVMLQSASGAPRYVELKPLSQVVTNTPSAVQSGSPIRVPIITWGGDIATILANGNDIDTQSGSLFDRAGLSVRLLREDAFANQLGRYVSGESAFLRGTLGMITMAKEAVADDPSLEPVVVYQMTWSAGGDALVVKEGIRAAADLKGKTIAVQAYGPHVDYLIKILEDAGLGLDDVNVRWVPDLTGTDDSPMAALYEPDIDAAFVIIPDALALTSGGNIGTGGEDSVKGARILLSTKTANRIISDVYAVRADYLQANRDQVQAFVTALLNAQNDARAIIRASGEEKQRLLSASGRILLDSEQAISDAEGLFADCEFVGLDGNIKFFDDPSYPRRFEKLQQELAASYASLGLVTPGSSLSDAGWNFGALEAAVDTQGAVERGRFDEGEVAKLVTRKQQQGALGEGELFSFEVFFKPNQKEFSPDLYKDAFDRVIELASTYGGAIITVEGHSDPMGYLRKKQEGSPNVVLGRIKQSARNLSIGRAQAVRDNIIDYASGRSIALDPTQFAVVGHGIAQPASGVCGQDPCAPKTEQEWRSNMRVEFRILQVEAEADVFNPL